MPEQTRLNVQSRAFAVQLAAPTDDLVGVKRPTTKLISPDGKWFIQVPSELFPEFAPGEGAIVSLTLTRIAVEPIIDLTGGFQATGAIK